MKTRSRPTVRRFLRLNVCLGGVFFLACILVGHGAWAQFGGLGKSLDKVGCDLNAIAAGTSDCGDKTKGAKDACAAAVDQFRLEAQALADRLIDEWRTRFAPADPFDPLSPPAGVNPWGTLQAAINQYARDIEDMRQGRPSRWQRADARGTSENLRTGMLDRASAMATQRYNALDAAMRERLGQPDCGGGLAQALAEGGRAGWERAAQAMDVPYLWDGTPRP